MTASEAAEWNTLISVVWRRWTIDVESRQVDDLKQQVRATVDGVAKLEIDLPIQYVPGLTLGDSAFALWRNVSLAVYDGNRDVAHYWETSWETTDGEVIKVFSHDGYWVVISELAVDILTLPDLISLSHHGTADVILSIEMSGRDLVVEDFNGIRTRLALPSLDVL